MTHLREIRFAKQLGGHSRVKLGIRRQATSPTGEKVRPWLAWGTYLVVELDDAELAALEADRCYVLNVPEPKGKNEPDARAEEAEEAEEEKEEPAAAPPVRRSRRLTPEEKR
jgi:hypothetical protein